MNDEHAIVFFDGVCGLCNAGVDYLIRVDRRKTLRYAPLQGAMARKMLPDLQRASLETLFVVYRDRTYLKSDAWLYALGLLGGWHRLLLICRLVPRSIRDFLYHQVAKRRYRIFGRRETCRVPSPQERGLFFD